MEPTGEASSPWAMQLAARVERVGSPSADEICVAAVRAVTNLLDDERALESGPWAEALEAWQGQGRIRKLVRRARASAWERAQEPDGCTARAGRAEVRAYVPCPMDEVPAAVAKLQIQSTELEPLPVAQVLPAGATGMVLVVTPEVEMSWGKVAAQCSHAAQLLQRSLSDQQRAGWRDQGQPVSVAVATHELWAAMLADSEPPGGSMVTVRDGGFTEIPAGTLTAIGRWIEPGENR